MLVTHARLGPYHLLTRAAQPVPGRLSRPRAARAAASARPAPPASRGRRRPPDDTAATSCTSTWTRSSPAWSSDRPELVGRPSSRPCVGPQRGAVGDLRGARLRRALGDAGRPGAEPVPAGRHHPAPAWPVRLGLPGGHDHLPGDNPEVEPLSLDEAFLDVSGALRRLGRPAAIGALIRRQVAQQQGISCSVGIAVNKFGPSLRPSTASPMACWSSRRRRPRLPAPAAVSALWEWGSRPEGAGRLGLRTVGDIASTPLGVLEADLGRAAAAHLSALAAGGRPRR